MIIFLYGKDGYRLKQNIEKIAEEHKKKNASGMSFSVLDFGEATGDQLEKLENLIKTTTFFDEKRLIILKNTFMAGKEITAIAKTWDLAGDKQRIAVFAENFDEKELAKKDKNFFEFLSVKPNLVKTFKFLGDKELEKWAAGEIEKSGISIRPEALKKLIYYASGTSRNDREPMTTWQIKQEIEKLANYKAGGFKAGPIETSDIELLVAPKTDLNIFEVTDAFASMNKTKAILSLYKHLEAGTDPYSVFSMLVFQFRNLLRIKSMLTSAIPYADIARKTGLHPFVVKKSYEQCKKFDLDELKWAYSRLAQMEIDTKNGKADIAEDLYQFVFSLT